MEGVGCPLSMITAALETVINDLTNNGRRAVIVMSFAGSINDNVQIVYDNLFAVLSKNYFPIFIFLYFF